MWTRPTRRSAGEPEDEGGAEAVCRTTPRGEAPDDLLHLEDFNDNDLLRALWTRYERKEIYTWVGQVLVSVNPYKDIGALSEETVHRYASSSPPQAPHLFATVKAALAAPGNRHALLITGESGAGKTEATRAILSFLALRHTATDYIRDRLLRSTPVLEAFGNAHTRQNTNSSRFGKFIEVHLSGESNEVVGATLQPYMLEASRVAGDLPQGERTYHVFYLLRATLTALASGSPPSASPFWQRVAVSKEWADLVQTAGQPLADSSRLTTGPREDRCVASFEGLAEGLIGTGMRHHEVVECMRIVAAVALLAEGSGTDDRFLSAAASLLRVEEADMKAFLTKVEITAGGREKVFRSRNEREVATIRASLAQEMYAALFGWLTKLVARGIAPPKKSSSGGRMLGLLDLYGFEVFSSNGFEQFLINYCNERLQQFFNRQVFMCEAEEYSAEGLDADGQWRRLMTACTLPALGLLEGEPGKGLGIFGVINDRSRCGFEESSNGNGNAGTALADTIAGSSAAHTAFCRGAGRDASRVFGVKHFAGEVFYEAAHFVRKNASAHRPDIVSFLREKGSPFIREVLVGDEDKSDGINGGEEKAEDTPKPNGNSASKPRRKLFGRTLISVFQQELNELCTALEARSCRHVRCLRPNDDQAPLVFDDGSMLRQCRYSGLLEATRIRRQGYAHRRPLRTFAARYALLLNSREARRAARHAPVADAAQACAAICQAATNEIEAEDARIGHTKVFMRETALAWFEDARVNVASGVVVGLLRGIAARRRYQRLREATLRIQANVRGLLARAWCRRVRAEIRAAEAAAYAARVEACTVVLQRSWRRWTAQQRALLEVMQRRQQREEERLLLEQERAAQLERQLRAEREAAASRAAAQQELEDTLTASVATDQLLGTQIMMPEDPDGFASAVLREAEPPRARAAGPRQSSVPATLPISARTIPAIPAAVATSAVDVSPAVASRVLAASPAVQVSTPRAVQRNFQQESVNLIAQQQRLRKLVAETVDLSEPGASEFRGTSPATASVFRPTAIVATGGGAGGEPVYYDNHPRKHSFTKPIAVSSIAVPPSSTYTFRGETPLRGHELVRSLSARSVARVQASPRMTEHFKSPLRTRQPMFPTTSYSFTPRSQSCRPAAKYSHTYSPAPAPLFAEEPVTARRGTTVTTTWRRAPSPTLFMPPVSTVISTAAPSLAPATAPAVASVAVPSAPVPQWAWQQKGSPKTSSSAAPVASVSTKVVLRSVPTPSRMRHQSPLKVPQATVKAVPAATATAASATSASVPAVVSSVVVPSPGGGARTPSATPSRVISAMPVPDLPLGNSPFPSGMRTGGAGSRCCSPQVVRSV